MKAVSGRTANVLPALFLVWLLTAAAAVAVSVMAVRERRRNQALCAQLSDSEAQRHQVEDSLRQLGDRLRSSLDRSGVVTWTWYPNGDRVFWGGGPVESMFGFSREDVTSYAALRTHVHADDLSGLEKTIAEVLRTRIDYTAEFRVVHPSGEARWLLGRGGVRVEGGEVVEMSGVNVDITEQKLAQGQLEASERRFREMADAVPQVIWTSSASGELEYYNKRWYDLTGLSSDRKLSPEKRRAQIHPDDLPAEVEAWELAVRNGSTYEHELRYWDQSHQEYRWYSARARLLATPDGREAHWYGVATEVHERKLAEARLKESERTLREREEQLATVFREGAIGDFTWEIKEDQVYCHPTIWALYGEAEGTPVVSRPAAWFLARQHPDDQEMVEQAVAAMLRGDGPLHIEFRVIWPDGSIHWLICQASLVLDDRGKPVRTKGLNIDITERKKAEMKLRESEEQFRLLATRFRRWSGSPARMGRWSFSTISGTPLPVSAAVPTLLEPRSR